MSTGSAASAAPSGVSNSAALDAVHERLNDPGVAAALVTLLDNAELLSTLVLGLDGFVQRGDLIMDSVAESVHEFKAASGGATGDLPSVGQLSSMAGELAKTGPELSQLLRLVMDSSMARPETIGLLSEVAEAANEGVATARANESRVAGVRGLYGTLKDPDVQRGLGMLVEVARSLGRRLV